MSDTSQGPGWWLASDGKWYPPELWTGPPAAGPTALSAPTAGSVPTAAPAGPGPSWQYGAPGAFGTGAPGPYGYGSPGETPGEPGPAGGGPPLAGGYGPGPYPYAAATPRKTNGLAVASLVCSIVGLFLLTAILGVVFGFVARSQIRSSRGTQQGEGLAIAGIVVGCCWLAFFVVDIAINVGHQNGGGAIIPPLAVAGLLGSVHAFG